MKIKDIFKEENIILGARSTNKRNAINKLIDKHFQCGHIDNKDIFKEVIDNNKAINIGNVTILYGENSTVKDSSVVAMTDREGISFSNQQTSQITFMFAFVSGEEYEDFLKCFEQLIMDENIVQGLLEARSPKQFIRVINKDIKIEKKIKHEISDLNVKENIKVNTIPIIQEPNEEKIEQKEEVEFKVQEEKKINNKWYLTILNHLKNGIYDTIPLLMLYGIATTILDINNVNMSEGFVILEGGLTLQQVILSIKQITGFYILVFCANIAKSISGRTGFTVGFISGFIFQNYTLMIVDQERLPNILMIILLGFISGYVVLIVNKIISYLPKPINKTLSILLAPIIGVSVIFGINILLFTKFPNIIKFTIPSISLTNISIIIFGLIMGVMMTIDNGGPLHTIVYIFGIISIMMRRYNWMPAIMLASMIPSLMIGLTMIVYPKIFNEEELKYKWKYTLNGLCGTNKDIYMIMKDKKKEIYIPCMIATSIGIILSMYFGCTQILPQGGLFILPFIENSRLFLISLTSSTLIGISLIMILKK